MKAINTKVSSKTLEKTKHEIIDIVAKSYNIDKRAERCFPLRTCMYLTNDDKKCAVGMFLTDEALKKSAKCLGDARSLDVHLKARGFESLDSAFIKEVRGHEVGFWVDLQSLHDDNNFWNAEGLSEYGVDYVHELKRRYD